MPLSNLQCVVALLSFVCLTNSWANEVTFPKRPGPGTYIVDAANALSAIQRKDFNTRLSAHYHQNSVQLVFIIINTKDDYGAKDIGLEEYGKSVRKKWYAADWATRGILTVISLSDGKVSACIREYVVPNRRPKLKALIEANISKYLAESKNNLAQGMNAALKDCFALYTKKEKPKRRAGYYLKLAFFFAFILWMVNIVFYKREVSKFWYYVGYPIWLVVGIFTTVAIEGEMLKQERAAKGFNPFD